MGIFPRHSLLDISGEVGIGGESRIKLGLDGRESLLQARVPLAFRRLLVFLFSLARAPEAEYQAVGVRSAHAVGGLRGLVTTLAPLAVE